MRIIIYTHIYTYLLPTHIYTMPGLLHGLRYLPPLHQDEGRHGPRGDHQQQVEPVAKSAVNV